MIQTFLANWPSTVDLYVYAEDCVVQESAPNLHVLDLLKASPELVKFKQTWKGVPKANGDVSTDPVRSRRKDAGKGFKWDAVRFSHKVYSVFHCAKHCNSDILFWMDADTVCHSPISIKDIVSMSPTTKDLCYLGRAGKYSECGLYSINLKSAKSQNFLQFFQQAYDNADSGIFTLDEWHDSFVFDSVRKQVNMAELNWSEGLIKGEGHPLINCQWGSWLDHLKGNRKNYGHSLSKDLLVDRSESYWKTLVSQ
jgi:hypothetical protein